MFHSPSVAMIQNPLLKAYRYDPYCKVITAEGYDTDKMKANRLAAIQQASSAKMFGVVLGTLGRQGSPKIFQRLRALLRLHGRRCVLFLMAELNPAKLAAISHIEAWVQVSCPRLSIDWGAGFIKVSKKPRDSVFFKMICCFYATSDMLCHVEPNPVILLFCFEFTSSSACLDAL